MNIDENHKEIILAKMVIIGSGAGGLSAATYGARGMGQEKSVYCLMGSLPGGQLTTTDKVYNFIGYSEIDGFDVMQKCMEQSRNSGAILLYEWAQQIKCADVAKNLHEVHTESTIYKTPLIIIATGASHTKLPVKEEPIFRNKGIYYCATCDGPLFKNKRVVVVGGGNTALTEALFLASICSEVILVHRRDQFRAEPFLIDKVRNTKNIILELFMEIKQLDGKEKLESILIENNQTEEQKRIYTNSVFVAIGFEPNVQVTHNTPIELIDGYIKTNPASMETNIEGIYAIGDVTDKIYRQAVTAAGDGAKAAINGLKYLQSKVYN